MLNITEERESQIRLATMVILIPLAVVSLYRGLYNATIEDGSQDTQWSPSRTLLQHDNPYELFLKYKMDQDKGSPFILCQAPNYPASGLIFLWPYAAFPWAVAKILWAVSNVLFTAAIVIGLRRMLPDKSLYTLALLATLFVIGSPHRVLIACGQHALFCLAFFVWAVLFSQKNKWIAGIFLAISWFKYTVTFPLSLFFIAKRRFSVLLLAVAAHIVLTFFASLWTHSSPVDLLLGPMKVALLGGTGHGYLDISALAYKLGISHRLIPVIICVALTLLATIVMIKRGTGDDLLILSMLALLSYVLFLHLVYDLVLLIFPLCYVLRNGLDGILAFLFAACVALNWYVTRLVCFLTSRFESPFGGYLDTYYYVVVIFLFYACLAYALLHLWRSRRISP